MSNGYNKERQERRELPSTGFRCFPAIPESITCNMVINIGEMISFLEEEKAKGQDQVKLTMLPTVNPQAKTSHFFTYDDFKPTPQGGGSKPRNNVTPMPASSIPEDDIPF